MKRRAPRYRSLRPAKFESDPEKAYTTGQMAKIGAITLKCNQIESHIDFVGSSKCLSVWPQTGAAHRDRASTNTLLDSGRAAASASIATVREGQVVRGITFSMLGVLSCTMIVASSPARADRFQSLHSFQGGSDGAEPQTALVDCDGMLYGTTFVGGGDTRCQGQPDGCGTVYSINPATGAEAVVYAFGFVGSTILPTDGLTNVGGTLYGGAASGTVYSLNLSNDTVTPLHTFPDRRANVLVGSFVKFGDKLYGTARYGGQLPSGNGAVVSVGHDSGHGAVVHFFRNRNGSTPEDGVINVGGTLYGTTSQGGAYCCGTVFALNPKTGAFKVIHSFGNSGDGRNPVAGLLNVGGTLYGTTENGGTANYGTVFSVDLTTGTEVVLHSFMGGNDGRSPEASLIEARGRLYGTTYYGGATRYGGFGYGSVFWVDPATGADHVVHRFQNSDGSFPTAHLLKFGRTLYGTTSSGGTAGYGTVFSYKL